MLAVLSPFSYSQLTQSNAPSFKTVSGVTRLVGPNMPEYLSCPQPFCDNCLCRSNLTASAINYFNSCVNSVCSDNTVDLM